MKAKHINQFKDKFAYLCFNTAPAATKFSRLKRSGFKRDIISRVSTALFMSSLPMSRFPVFRIPTLFSPTIGHLPSPLGENFTASGRIYHPPFF